MFGELANDFATKGTLISDVWKKNLSVLLPESIFKEHIDQKKSFCVCLAL